jgi:hypothetical protein
MGRPIKSKFFGNRNSPYDNEQTGENSGVGGEGVATITKNNTGTYYSISTTTALSFTAPQIKGGVAPTGRVTTNALGNVATVTLLTAGTGYTAAPTATVVGGTTGTVATFNVTLFASTVTQNAIAFSSFLLDKDGGTTAVTGGDILKQESSRRYLVSNSEGTGQVKLVAKVPAAGEMTIIATDTGNATYYVKKLTAHRATLVNISGTPLFADNSIAGWTLGSPSLGIVSIASN